MGCPELNYGSFPPLVLRTPPGPMSSGCPTGPWSGGSWSESQSSGADFYRVSLRSGQERVSSPLGIAEGSWECNSVIRVGLWLWSQSQALLLPSSTLPYLGAWGDLSEPISEAISELLVCSESKSRSSWLLLPESLLCVRPRYAQHFPWMVRFNPPTVP